MKIYDYYRNTANISLNGSIAALFPAALIVMTNLYLFKNQEIMLLTIPFFFYSFFGFQLYLFKMKQSFSINRYMEKNKLMVRNQSLYNARELLIFLISTKSPTVMLYFPDGHLAGYIQRMIERRKFFRKTFVLCNQKEEAVGFFQVKGKWNRYIEVYDQERNYIGCFEKKRQSFMKYKKELLDSAGMYVGFVEGSSTFMDERVFNDSNQQIVRLRRGWMPLEWSSLFPEPNTPVLSFSGEGSEKDKLLSMSFLINEYFIER
ncbi:hypothetical protein [Neobacillus endophyticus]|uniref:hypothetical protein n=1 Tax=Neobacillus endophyticus TaxID=2738405 RepID=UPI001C27B5FD|nr:hypothetical protein [Neobacillus endophyticus]